MSFLDKMKKASKSVVDAGAKQMLKVRSWAVRIQLTRMTMIMSSVVHVQNSFFCPCPRCFSLFEFGQANELLLCSLCVVLVTTNNNMTNNKNKAKDNHRHGVTVICLFSRVKLRVKLIRD